MPPLADLHRASLPLYRDLAAGNHGFEMGSEPAGLLLLSEDDAAVSEAAAAIRRSAPELAPEALAVSELGRLEPALAPGLVACRLATAYPVVPSGATRAYAFRAARAGVVIRTANRARPVMANGRIEGVAMESGERLACGQVLVAAGPWSV